MTFDPYKPIYEWTPEDHAEASVFIESYTRGFSFIAELAAGKDPHTIMEELRERDPEQHARLAKNITILEPIL